MLVAQLENGTRIELVDRWTRSELLHLRTKETFYCPSCKGEVILKLGTKKQWHFAHVRDNEWCESYERESNFHLLGKKQLYVWLKQQHFTVHLEKFFPQMKQRPDIYYEHAQNKVALEFQCSPISHKLHYERTTSYLQNDIYPLWIIGANRLQRLSNHIFQLHSFEWASTFSIKNQEEPYLIYYCAYDRTFTLLKNIISLSKSRIFASSVTKKISSISSFYELFTHHENNRIHEYWLQMKKHWRYRVTPFPSRAQRFFYEYCYSQQISPFLYPPISGWPLPYSFYIETPLYIWQSWIVYEFIFNKSVNDVVQFYDVYEAFKHLVKLGVFTVRTLLLHEGHYSFALMNYLHLLCKFRILRKKNNRVFIINKKVDKVTTIEEAFVLDEYYSKMFM